MEVREGSDIRREKSRTLVGLQYCKRELENYEERGGRRKVMLVGEIKK